MINKLRAILLHPRRAVTKKMIQVFGDYETKLRANVIARPNYGFCLYNAAKLAERLGYTKISVIEFGVAGGNGLLNFEYHAEQVCKLIPIEIEIYGFDRGEGLPKPVDYRDLPYHWKEGFYKMDVEALEAKLTKAKLILGDISDTLSNFVENCNPAPIGAISFDLDFYSSTKSALAVFNTNHKYLLPRVFCYFDDTIGTDISLYNDFTGQRLAIKEFNKENENIKLGYPYHLSNSDSYWRNQIWIAHLFHHPHYNTFVSDMEQQLPLDL
jgi:hypothetical protein